MGILFLLIFFVISLFIVGLVLLQEGKGGGLTGMSTGMDGVMGAKNPLRRMTAYLFVAFVVMCLAINMYFHNREDTALPAGVAIETPVPAPAAEPLPAGSLRPEAPAETAPAAPIAAPAETPVETPAETPAAPAETEAPAEAE